MNIVLYYQASDSSIYLESLVESFIKKGHTVYFITICERGEIHRRMEQVGAIAIAHKINSHRGVVLLKQAWFLVKFCRKHKIDVVYSHLQVVSFIAVFAQRFMKAKVFPCRHHIDEVALIGNRRAIKMESFVNRKAKKIIVVSNASKKRMVDHEGVRADKIEVIKLGYDFSHYDPPNLQVVESIRHKMPCKLMLIMMARMTENKRHVIGIELIEKLIKDGLDVKMLMLGDGVERPKLEAAIKERKLESHIWIVGFVTNITDYLAAADILVSPSIIESSNQVVKEASLLSKPSIACRGIGDYDEYFIHRENSFLVSKDDTANEMKDIITEYYDKKDQLLQMGERLKKEVLERFDIKNISDKHLALPFQA